MSTLLDFLHVPVRMEDVTKNARFEHNAEPPWGARELEWNSPVYGIDEFHEYVTFNMFNELYPGSGITINTTDEYEHWLTPLYNGHYTTDINAFNFGVDDFTIELQFGIGSYYDYNELEGLYSIPLFCLGTDTSVSNTALMFYMTNPGRPNYVQQGYLCFYAKDTEGLAVDISISPSDWYLPTTPGYMHAEFSRRDQTFYFKLLSLYGQKIASTTSANFGSIDVNDFTRFYIGTLPTYGSLNSRFRSFKVTKGFCRNPFSSCAGVYNTWHRKSKARPTLRMSANSYCLNALSKPIVGLPDIKLCVADIKVNEGKFSAYGVIDCNKAGFCDIEILPEVTGTGLLPETDPYISNVLTLFNASDYVSTPFSVDALGGTVNWRVNYNYNWYTVPAPLAVTCDGIPSIDGITQSGDYTGYRAQGILPVLSTDTLPGDFTVEAYVYLTNLATAWNKFIFSCFNKELLTHSCTIKYFGSTSAYDCAALSKMLNRRLYIAIVRSGTTLTLYIDGVEYASGTLSGTLVNTDNTTFIIHNGIYRIDGYIFSFRLTKGVARTITPRVSVNFPTE